MTPADGIRDQLALLLGHLGDEEAAVLFYLGKRLLTGQLVYGAMHLEEDTRDFEHEACEEDADGAIYRAMRRVQVDLRRRKGAQR